MTGFVRLQQFHNSIYQNGTARVAIHQFTKINFNSTVQGEQFDPLAQHEEILNMEKHFLPTILLVVGKSL